MGTGSGYGKVILFGEHFVVHGNPSIVSAINTRTTATVEEKTSPGIEVVDSRPATKGYKEEKKEHAQKSLGYILAAMSIDPSSPLRITLAGDLFAASGVGASAASCTAIARALSAHFNMNLSDERINKIAWEGERGYHGNPSGVDNTASTFGGFLWFRKTESGPVFEKIHVMEPLHIVMGNSGPTANTLAAVEKVRKLKEASPDIYAEIAKKAEDAAAEARQALESHDVQAIGRLMDTNHTLLQEVGVSTERLDEMVTVARQNGSIGAKLTGGGLGGYMVALVPDANTQMNVANALKAVHPDITMITTTIG